MGQHSRQPWNGGFVRKGRCTLPECSPSYRSSQEQQRKSDRIPKNYPIPSRSEAVPQTNAPD
jgi:hypothetical protein